MHTAAHEKRIAYPGLKTLVEGTKAMKITTALKSWLQEKAGLKADAADADVKAAASTALVDGKLDAKTFGELQADPDAEKAAGFEAKLDAVLGRMSAIETKMAGGTGTETPPASGEKPAGEKGGEAAGTKKASAFEKMFAGSSGDGSGEEVVTVRVKGAHESYATERKSAYFPERMNNGRKHPLAGQRIFEGGKEQKRFIDHPSDLDQAVAGAYVKFAIHSETGGRGIPQVLKMTQHDMDLMQWALHNAKWGGVIHGIGTETEGAQGVKNEKLTPSQQKAILDDSTSGGLEIAPIAFDDQIIFTPLLNGEFFPRVNVVPITRGRRIESASMGNVTLSSGGADGTDIPLFNTAAFIAAFDTSIFVCNGAIEIGMDFLSDSPIDVASTVTGQYGQVLLTWLDEQIAVGDGTTEPEGILVGSGTTSVAGGSAAPTVGVYESFLFSVPKRYKQGYPADRIMFGANETTYQRARAIAVSGTDARRIFGMTHEDYMLFGHPYGICEAIANTKAFFCNMARFRMYRRLGLTVKVTTEGKTLVRANQMLITARARYGGQLEDGAAAGVSTTMQA